MRSRDRVTGDIAMTVMTRDLGCVAPLLDPGCTPCRDRWGRVVHRSVISALTFDHVKDDPRMGLRAPSDPRHLVTLCWGHHIATTGGGSNWATAHRPMLRDYLARMAGGGPNPAPDERKG